MSRSDDMCHLAVTVQREGGDAENTPRVLYDEKPEGWTRKMQISAARGYLWRSMDGGLYHDPEPVDVAFSPDKCTQVVRFSVWESRSGTTTWRVTMEQGGRVWN